MANINFQKIDSKYLESIISWFDNNHYLSQYQIVLENEDYFRSFLNVPTFKFTNSATNALYLIMQFIKKKFLKKDTIKVLGPAFGHPSWINVCRWLNLEFNFIDVKKETLSLNPKLLEDKIRDFDVVIFIDKAGYCNEDLYKTKEICKQYNKILIEDSANAFGQMWKDKDYAGTVADFAIYSFSNPKIITAGEGGSIVSTIDDFNNDFECYIYQGCWYSSHRTKFKDIGLNFSMNAWLTQLLKYQLDDLNEIQKRKHDLFLYHLSKWNNKLIYFDSINKYYSPSFFAIVEEDKRKKNVMLKTKQFDYKLYRNMGRFFTNNSFPVSDYLEENLFYLENK